MHHADSFALIRSGRIDVTVLGAYEVAENGDFANWKMAGQQGGGIGGAMDLAACAKHVFVAMEHQTRDGKPRLVERCAIPATARGVVNLVVTNFGLFEITKEGMALREIAPGVTVDEVESRDGLQLADYSGRGADRANGRLTPNRTPPTLTETASLLDTVRVRAARSTGLGRRRPRETPHSGAYFNVRKRSSAPCRLLPGS